MNKTELVDFIAENAGLTKAASTSALSAIIDGIMLSLEKGEPVVLANFGTFLVKAKAARDGRNPATGEKIKIAASKIVSFKAGKGLKDAVKGSLKEVAEIA